MKRLITIIFAVILFLCIWKICDYIVPHSPFDPDDERTKLINQHWNKLMGKKIYTFLYGSEEARGTSKL